MLLSAIVTLLTDIEMALYQRLGHNCGTPLSLVGMEHLGLYVLERRLTGVHWELIPSEVSYLDCNPAFPPKYSVLAM